MEVDLQAEDYTTVVGENQGKTIEPLGLSSSVSRDYNSETNTVTYIDAKRRVSQELFVDSVTSIETVPEDLKTAMEIEDNFLVGSEVSRFGALARHGNFWVFSDDLEK